MNPRNEINLRDGLSFIYPSIIYYLSHKFKNQ